MTSALFDMLKKNKITKEDLENVVVTEEMKQNTFEDANKAYKSLYKVLSIIRIEALGNASLSFFKLQDINWTKTTEINKLHDMLEIVHLCNELLNEAQEEFEEN